MRLKRETVLRLFQDNNGMPLEFRELMVAFRITKARREEFKYFMDGLVAGGDLVKVKGNRYMLPARDKLLTGRLSAHRDGYGFVTPEGGGDDVFVPARYLRENMHGDRVEVRVEKYNNHGKREGRIIRTLERGFSRIVGRFESTPRFGYVMPDEVRLTQDIYIPPDCFGGASSGQVVVAEITAYPTAQRNPEGRIVEVLGLPDDPEVEVKTIVRKYDLPVDFSPAALAAARATSQQVAAADMAGRNDLRGNLTVTIDGETAKDFDDAVAVRREEGGQIRLWVSIADVSHYVRPGSDLDSDAYLRGTSVYFPDRCIPMLPEELSNGICSLNPQVDRLTVTAEMLFDQQGGVIEQSFYPSVIRSNARLTYTIVRQVLVDRDAEVRREQQLLIDDLEVMQELALRLMAKRKQRGSIDFDLPEPEIILDLQGRTEAIIKAERNFAHRIIEEFMLAANEAVASMLEERSIPSLYRVHEPPDPEKLRSFQEFIFNFGYTFTMRGDEVDPRELQRLIEQAEGKPEERMINEVLLRCMKQARYASENLGHFGLAAESYTHFTSPIRRYPDLIIHRLLKGVLAEKPRKKELEAIFELLPEIAGHTSKRERVAMEAEREIVELKKMQFMQSRVGEEFEGFITGVSSFGFFVELIDLFVEGMVHVSTLRDDFYRYIENQHTLLGERGKDVYRIGDRVRIKVAGVSLEKKRIEFVLAELLESRVSTSAPAQGESYSRQPIRGKRPVARTKKEDGGDGKGGGRNRGKPRPSSRKRR